MKADYGVSDSSKKRMEHTQNGILSGFHLFLEESGTSYFAFEIYRHLEKKSQKPEIIIFHDFFHIKMRQWRRIHEITVMKNHVMVGSTNYEITKCRDPL